MSIRIDGTNTTANPGITGGDADTGLQFGTDEISFVTGGTNRATVESNGNFTIENGNLVVAAGHGIDFSADANAAGMTSELLEDYEEGTWTPLLFERVGGTGDYVEVTNATYNTSFNGAWYQKVGNTVKFGGSFRLTNKGSITGSDYVGIGGVPYPAKAEATPYGEQRSATVVYIATNISTTSNRILAANAPVSGLSWIPLYWMDWDTGVSTAVVGTDINNSTYLVSFSGHYITD
jgi:hypothetical protein